MNIYKKIIRPALFHLYPETAHNAAISAGYLIGKINNPVFDELGKKLIYKNKNLETELFGIKFENPLGMAAGFDKNGKLLNIAHYAGFGFHVVGSVTAKESKGNNKPRIFRLPEDEAIINRIGLENYGATKISILIKKSKPKIPYFVSIAKTHNACASDYSGFDDILSSFRKLHQFGCGTILNISCPNTSESRKFEEPDNLENLLSKIDDERCSYDWKPVFLKISPDIKNNVLERDIEICKDYDINGFVICNTTESRECLKTNEKNTKKLRGGLSGKPLKLKSNKLIEQVYKIKEEDQSIIGVGGIFSGKDAYEKILLGSNLEKIFTAIPYEGPFVCNKINYELSQFLEHDGFRNISEAVGYYVK